MRTLLWILAACGALYVIGLIWGAADDLKSTIDAVNRQVDSLEREIRDLGGEVGSATGS